MHINISSDKWRFFRKICYFPNWSIVLTGNVDMFMLEYYFARTKVF